MTTTELLKQLDSNLSVLTGEDITERYCVDWTFVEHCKPQAVLRPSNVEDVATILRHCHQTHQPVVVQGGMTGLAGGATPSSGEISLSMESFNGIEEIDEQAMTMTVKSGTPLAVIQQAALDKGLMFPVDLGARGSATIGGMVSTNAGGVQVIRYGMTRALIMGLEVVLPDGTVISSLNKMLKNNAGFDLKHLFIGSEGTLGVVTRVVVRLFPQPQSRCTAMIAFNEFSDTVTLLRKIQKELAGLINSYEVMWDLYFDNVAPLVKEFNNPFDEKYGTYAIIEVCGNNQQKDTQTLEAFLSAQLESGLICDVVIAQNETQADNLWSVRHGSGNIESNEPLINYDVSIPIGDMDTFAKALMQRIDANFPDITTLLFGHIGDSNLHVVIGNYEKSDFVELKDLVHDLTGEFSGSVSAEHGIGKLKTSYLPLSRSAEEIALMKLLKNAIDPAGILNRGRVIQA